jgi:hypothetical protein
LQGRVKSAARPKLEQTVDDLLEQAVDEGRRIANEGNEERGIGGSLKNIAGRAASIVSGIIEQFKDKITSLFGGGASSDESEAELDAWIDDYSEMVAVTEIHAAVEESIVETWHEQGYTKLWWQCEIGEDVCEKCLANMEASPIAMGDAFPSGDATPPAHPRCRCSLEKY